MFLSGNASADTRAPNLTVPTGFSAGQRYRRTSVSHSIRGGLEGQSILALTTARSLASEAGELVQILGTLMLANQPYMLLQGAVYIHPTLAEGFFSLMEDLKSVG